MNHLSYQILVNIQNPLLNKVLLFWVLHFFLFIKYILFSVIASIYFDDLILIGSVLKGNAILLRLIKLKYFVKKGKKLIYFFLLETFFL